MQVWVFLEAYCEECLDDNNNHPPELVLRFWFTEGGGVVIVNDGDMGRTR